MKNKEKTTRTKLISKLHLLKAQLHQTDDEYRAFLASFKVESSTSLSDAELIRAVGLLQELLDGSEPAMAGGASMPEKPQKPVDKWKDPEQCRRRVMASIGAWLRTQHRPESKQIIQGIALNAAGSKYTDFNKIPVSRLNSIYYEFVNKKKVADNVRFIKAHEIAECASLN